MRIRLKRGKQKELINLAKQNLTWQELSRKLNLSEGYLRNELRKEERLLSKDKYNLLCNILKINFDRYILAKLDENWGQSKGGTKSTKNTKKIHIPKKDENLSEIIGIILGDGHVSEFKRGKKIRCYSIRIAGNSEVDKDYIINYIPSLFKKVFDEKGSLHFSKKAKVGYFTIYGKNYIDLMKKLGIKSGNKKKNNQGIPKWINENKKYLSKCIRGLIDTDGSVHYISKTNLNLRISYTSHIPNLLKDAREGLIKLKFSPSKIINNRQFYLSKQKEINRYLKEIGFGNSKNLNRLNLFKKRMPL